MAKHETMIEDLTMENENLGAGLLKDLREDIVKLNNDKDFLYTIRESKVCGIMSF